MEEEIDKGEWRWMFCFPGRHHEHTSTNKSIHASMSLLLCCSAIMPSCPDHSNNHSYTHAYIYTHTHTQCTEWRSLQAECSRGGLPHSRALPPALLLPPLLPFVSRFMHVCVCMPLVSAIVVILISLIYMHTSIQYLKIHSAPMDVRGCGGPCQGRTCLAGHWCRRRRRGKK